MQKEKSHFHIGMRNLKTAIAATLCALIYFPFDRNPTFACIGAIFGIGSNMKHSLRDGGNRLAGTIIGGFLGMGLFGLYHMIHPPGSTRPLLFLFLFLGLLVLVIVSRICRCPGAIPAGGVVLCIILFNTPFDTYVEYSFNRMFDTAFGVAIGLLVNLVPREWFHLDPIPTNEETTGNVVAEHTKGMDEDGDDIEGDD